MDFKAKEIVDYEIIAQNCNSNRQCYPYVKDSLGSIVIKCISPTHGRSFVLKKNHNSDWIVGKGNGLGYSTFKYLINSSIDSDTWGGLSLEHALRDYNISNEIRNLGIKTNKMEYVIELPYEIIFHGRISKAAILQYSVECPYRISDYGFIPFEFLREKVNEWKPLRKELKNRAKHLIAADCLFHNLSKLHYQGILHNAITPQNYTWSLELLDFEASHTPQIPFGSAEYQSFIPMIMEMEILKTYEIVNMIAWVLKETPEFHEIEKIIELYGFKLATIKL